jgi:transposase
MELRLGVDIACRAAHQASLADERGEFLWSGRSFRTTPRDLDRLWAMLPPGADPADLTVVMEPTRNAWVPLAAWFRRRGATVVLVPPERAADLRAYYAKHTKSDRLDSRLLARLPLLHPEGLHPERGLGPGDALRRATKLHSTLVLRRGKSLARLDALLEILGPSWHAALGGDLANKTPLRFLAAGYADPDTVRRLGRSRLARFFARHSRGAWGEAKADELLRAASETLALWDGDLDYPDLAEDIALEARLALALTGETKELDERIAVLLAQVDPAGIVRSAPGIGAITGAAIVGRLGDPGRFSSLAAARSFSGLVPSLDASGQSGRHGGPTKRGDDGEGIAGGLERDLVVGRQGAGERLDGLRVGGEPPRRAHLARLGDGDLAEVAADVGPDRAHDDLLSGETRRANDNYGSVLTAYPGSRRGGQLQTAGSRPIENRRPARPRSPGTPVPVLRAAYLAGLGPGLNFMPLHSSTTTLVARRPAAHQPRARQQPDWEEQLATGGPASPE